MPTATLKPENRLDAARMLLAHVPEDVVFEGPHEALRPTDEEIIALLQSASLLDACVENGWAVPAGEARDAGEAPLASALRQGAQLHAIIQRLNAALDVIKEELRREALVQKGEDKTVALSAGGITAKVTFPEATAQVRAKADMGALKQALGPAFGNIFSEKVSYAPQPAFHANASALEDEDLRQKVLASVEVKEATPRVKFEE